MQACLEQSKFSELNFEWHSWWVPGFGRQVGMTDGEGHNGSTGSDA
jgi:hypothetical protein